MDAKHKHLEFIQGVINRLAADSSRIKGWTVFLVSAILVFLAQEGSVEYAWVVSIPLLAFWGLDGYFLWQERLFRDLYDHVRTLEDDEIDFSMNIGIFDQKWLNATFSRTLALFYMALALLTGAAIFLG